MSVTTERTVVVPFGPEGELHLALKTYQLADVQHDTDTPEQVEERLRYYIERIARFEHLAFTPPRAAWVTDMYGAPVCVTTLRGVTVDDPDLLVRAQAWVNAHATELQEGE